MKRLFLVLLCLTALAPLRAQVASSSQKLSFVYIAHDENTAVSVLTGRLKRLYENAVDLPEENAVIFYLPNGESPITVRVNTANDNRNDFGSIIDELQSKRSHDVDRYTDLARIQEIFEENDIVDADGNPRFRSVEFLYYVNSTFWDMGNHEFIIASLFWIMDMEKYVKSNYMRVNIFYGKDDAVRFNENEPFGHKALCRSMRFIPMPY